MPNTTLTKRRRIWQDGDTVYLRDEDELGDELVRAFWVPPGGGYVRETSATRPGTLGQQVCEYLADRGNTLYCQPDELLALIRTEYRRAVRLERSLAERPRYRCP